MQSMLAHVKERTRLDNLDTQVLMQPSQFGRRDGSNLHVALLGRPNAGTSTLFNALAGRRTSASPFLGETRRVNRGRSEHRTPEFEWLCQLYMPASARPVTYALSDCPSHAMARLRCPREEALCEADGAKVSDEPTMDPHEAILELCPGAAGADVVMVVLRAFEGDEVTHQATTVDPARDLLYVANACRLHDVWKLKRRIQVLRDTRAGEWVVCEKEALLRAQHFLTQPDAGGRGPFHALRQGTWSDNEVAWLEDLGLLTDKAWVVAINVDCRPWLRKAVPADLVKPVEARATKLGINPRYCVVYSGAFEKRLQILRETPTPPPVEEHMRARPPLEAYLDANVDHASAAPALLGAPLDALQLILLFTCSPDEVRAWFVRDGTTVIGFCGGVHEVMRRNFEVAEICDYADYVACGSEEQVRRKGKVRRLGADVVLEHHQVIFVKFKIPRESEAADGRVAWNSDGRLSTREMDKKAQQDMAVQEEARKQLDEETDHHVRTGLRF